MRLFVCLRCAFFHTSENDLVSSAHSGADIASDVASGIAGQIALTLAFRSAANGGADRR